MNLNLTPQEAAVIDSLVSSGLYGATREECAERLISRAILDLIESEVVDLQGVLFAAQVER